MKVLKWIGGFIVGLVIFVVAVPYLVLGPSRVDEIHKAVDSELLHKQSLRDPCVLYHEARKSYTREQVIDLKAKCDAWAASMTKDQLERAKK